MEATSVICSGVERRSAPNLSQDGTALESINLRPTETGLELVHNKRRVSRFSVNGIQPVTQIFRHRCLPAGYYIVVTGKRKLLLYGEDDSTYRKRMIQDIDILDEDIISIGELNNILVVRTSTRQSYYLWNNGKYSFMPQVSLPKAMTLTQDFEENPPSQVLDRPFFGAVIGFITPSRHEGDFDTQWEDNKKKCLDFVQAVRAEEESLFRKVGKFVGHVLVRCAFRTKKDNYISYGPVVHAEIGSYAGTERTSRFPRTSEEEEGMEWYQRVFAKIIDDPLGAGDIYLPDGGEEGAPLYPIPCLRWSTYNGSSGEQYPPTYIIKKYSEGDNVCNAGYSQPPVYIGKPPKPVYDNEYFRDKYTDSEKRGVVLVDGDNRKPMAMGVYSPSMIYSYPVLRMYLDEDTISTLEYYRDNDLVQSLCVAMTAPVRHGFGTDLVKVGSVNAYNYLGEIGESGNYEIMEKYGYPTNIDARPDTLMEKPFYIVRDIDLAEIIDMARKNKGEVAIPIQLKDIGAIETRGKDGRVEIEYSEELITSSQEELSDTDYVSLSNIEQAKILPTDNFTAHTMTGNSLFEYNSRLHLFGVNMILSEGYSPTMAGGLSQKGFGNNMLISKGNPRFDNNLYIEFIIETDRKKILRRSKIDSYMTYQGGGDIMIVSDIITYPDTRCKEIRIVKKKEGKFYRLHDEWKCKSSVLNNLSYVANTSENKEDLPTLKVRCERGMQIMTSLDIRKPTSGNDKTYYVGGVPVDSYKQNNQFFEFEIKDIWHAYADSDTLIYIYRYVLLSIDEGASPIDYTGIDMEGVIEDMNRVQVSAVDDVFAFPAVNSYRIGSLDNRIIAAGSVYGQMTEQKFGLFPLYIFSKEGIFTMEQGSGDILYQNISMINSDMLTGERSLCNASDMIAYVVADGLKIIRGKESMNVSRPVEGNLYLELSRESVFGESVVSLYEYISREGFAKEIQGSRLLWDSYNHEVVTLCDKGNMKGAWAYNAVSGKFYKRADDASGYSMDTVINEGNILYSTYVSSLGGFSEVSMYDFRSSDQMVDSRGNDDISRFLYVSNPIKAGSFSYKHFEREILRFFGVEVSMYVRFFGSADGKKWSFLGGGMKGDREISDFTMRRLPRSVRYLIYTVDGQAKDLKILSLDLQYTNKYTGKIR